MMRTRYWLGIACAGVLLAVGAHFVPTGESEEEQVERQRAEIERPTAVQQAELAALDCEPEACVEDYLAFVEEALEHARPTTEAELDATMQEFFEKPFPSVEHVTTESMREDLIEGLNIGFLLEGLNERVLTVQELEVVDRPSSEGRQVRLRFSDPFVGRFDALLLLPEGPGPHPVVVVHPGHSERVEAWRDSRGGLLFPRAGLALAILQPRASGSDASEDRATRALLVQGFTLIGLRVYETLLLRKYLRWRQDIAPGRIGLLGHSGGSAMANLSIRVALDWQACSTDMDSVYADWSERPMLLDETAPAIRGYVERIRELETAVVPTLRSEYGYPDGLFEALAFFEEQLAD